MKELLLNGIGGRFLSGKTGVCIMLCFKNMHLKSSKHIDEIEKYC